MKRKAEKKTLDRLHVLDERGARRYVYAAEVSGRFARLRVWVHAVLVLVYVALPFVKVNGKPAILIDIPARHFFLFGKTFNAQDFYLAYFLLTGIGFALIALSALFGRVWCGWACPQTVFLDFVFRPVERFLEGNAAQRARLAQAPWTIDKLLRKAAKHGIYVLVAFALAHVFLSYFVTMPGLLTMMRQSPSQHMTPFLWASVMTGIFYFNFWWFREQLCTIMCPYGRLQSALQDRDTVVIGYDRLRGEPRGKQGTPGAGDCVDCGRCVAVCPTDIDIRNGLQLECIGCTACIDACDEIMVRLGRPTGLVRHDSERAFQGEERRFLRPRVYGYIVAGLVGATVATTMFIRHQPFEANLLRTSGQLPFVVDGGVLRNQYVLHVINKNTRESELTITPRPMAGVNFIIPQAKLVLPPLGDQRAPLLVSIDRDAYRVGMTVLVQVHDGASGEDKLLTGRVLGPPSRWPLAAERRP